MSRSKAREIAVMMIYSGLVGGKDTPKDVCEKLEEPNLLDKADVTYAAELADGVAARAEELDELIEKYAVGWSLARIARVDLAILRVAIYEILYREDVPTGAAINEAVELAKRYGGDKSSSFINGILGAFVRETPNALEQET